MESVGDFFKQVRETKGLTLDEVASKTRINPDFLRALEEGNFSKLPDQVFAKGFVRSYARSLGLDEEDAMRRFVESAGTFYEKQSELEQLRVRQEEDERRKKANRKVVIAAVAVALLALVLLLGREQAAVSPGRQSGEPEQTGKKLAVPSRPAPAQPAPAPSETAPAVAPQTQGSQPSEPAASLPMTSAPNEPLLGLPLEGDASRDGLTLDIEALELSWVVVQVDGASPHEALLRPGERARWKAADRFTLTLGNAGGVRVELNGKPVGPFGPSGKVARDIVIKRP
ncbi:MAG: RodZ domain-containing protein [Nitrospirota bacterium]